jgi:hypothetical protein
MFGGFAGCSLQSVCCQCQMEPALKSGLDICDGAMLASLIRATDHFQQGAIDHPLKHILLGADLTILGENLDIYNAYAFAFQPRRQLTRQSSHKFSIKLEMTRDVQL